MANTIEARPALTPDQCAAHEFLSEVRTRIAAQPLPYQYGVESRALSSLVELFGLARHAMKKNPGCEKFVALTTDALNTIVRPVTEKWHRGLDEGRLNSRDGADEFRSDLNKLREDLRSVTERLHEIAYGGAPFADKKTPPPMNEQEVDRCFKPVKFGIAKQPSAALAKINEKADSINLSEAGEIRKRRGTDACETKDGENAVGLALSGGGIRSATFCLGVVQVLADRDLIKEVDFLSTVSGGGYTGSFLTVRLGTGKPWTEVAHPRGPDTEAIAYLRQNAKYLAAVDLKQRWAMVTATIAGLLLNWTAPFFVLAAFAWAAVLFTDQFPFDDWRILLEIMTAGALGSLLFYAYQIKTDGDRTRLGGRLVAFFLAALLVIAIAWALQAGFFVFFKVKDQILHPAWFGGTLTLGALIGAIPVITRLMPIFEDPARRKLILKWVLAAAGLIIPVCAVIVFYVFCFIGVLDQQDTPWHIIPRTGLLVILIAILGCISLFLLNINLTSPHRLYRDQLAKTFIERQENDPDDFNLQDINPAGRAPYHLINATANFPYSAAASLRDRKCDFFLFSKHWCGCPAAGYQQTERWKTNNNIADLPTAMAVSGAAVAPRMGLGSNPSLSALLSFLNVRLSFWILNPDRKSWFKVPGFKCLIDEMTGFNMSEANPWINLSDGGHIENMGIYELLRRRCKFIICVDGEADPDYQFSGLMTLVRHAQIDFGVRICPRLKEMKLDPKTNCSQTHAMMCRIYYPQTDQSEREIGLLLYLKLSVTGNESALINQYRIQNPEFPHQSTLDQFFDQEQFEAYRQLGVHVAEGLFSPSLVDQAISPLTMAAWFKELATNLLEPEAATSTFDQSR